MQSFLAYQRFGRHVKAQYERDKEKAATLKRHDHREARASSTASSATAATAPESEDLPEKDLENAGTRDGTAPGDLELHGTHSGPYAQSAPRPLDGTGVLQREETVETMGTHLGTALTGINVRTRTTREGGGKGKVFVVDYEGEDDMLNPHNWSYMTRWAAT